MSKCLDCDENCGLNNVTDVRCCFYCEFKGNCGGFCMTLESQGDYEDVARDCSNFVEE